MSGSLYDRLAAIRKSRESRGQKAEGNLPGTPSSPIPGEDLEDLRQQESRVWLQLGEGTWFLKTSWPLHLDQAALSLALECLGYKADLERVLFFDTETTGLSGGAGTLIFLAGTGRIHQDGFVLEQYFLEDYPYEAKFLEVLRESISNADLLVSYNGKSFDLPLLTNRLVMNRMPGLVPPHLDLLHPVRRFWKDQLPSCSLGNMERLVLGMERFNDLPGAEIPACYARYLRAGGGRPDHFPEILPLQSHHALDHVSMLLLLQRIGQELGSEDPVAVKPGRLPLSRPQAVPETDQGSLASSISLLGFYRALPSLKLPQRLGQVLDAKAEALLEGLDGLEASQLEHLPMEEKGMAQELLLRIALRMGESGRQDRRTLVHKTGASLGFPLCLRRLLIELEHRQKDPLAALNYLELYLEGCLGSSLPSSEDWEKRRLRLRSRIAAGKES